MTEFGERAFKVTWAGPKALQLVAWEGEAMGTQAHTGLTKGGHRVDPSPKPRRESGPASTASPQGCEPTGVCCWSCPGVRCCGCPRAHLFSSSRARASCGRSERKALAHPERKGHARGHQRPVEACTQRTSRSASSATQMPGAGAQLLEAKNNRASVTKGERPRL